MCQQLNVFKLQRGKVDWHVTKCVIISYRPTIQTKNPVKCANPFRLYNHALQHLQN